MPTIVPVILAGGEGRRLSPLSSVERPKQFLKLLKGIDDTLFQSSVRRALMISSPENIITVASHNYAELIFEQLREVNHSLTGNVLLEPCALNTTAAITCAAIHARKNFEDPILWVIPSDHAIVRADLLIASLERSIKSAISGRIVLFGITPTRADSNYGYILSGEAVGMERSVVSFIEKPKGDTLKFVSGKENAYWNSGMFLLSAETLFEELKKQVPVIYKNVLEAYERSATTCYGKIIDKDIYQKTEALPIDKAIIENAGNIVVCPVDIGWSDIGSWRSLWELSQAEGEGSPLENFLVKLEKAA